MTLWRGEAAGASPTERRATIPRERTGGGPEVLMHVITDFQLRGGAEMMLARLINARPDNAFHLVSLRSFSKDNLSLISNEHVTITALGVGGLGDIPRLIGRLASLIRQVSPGAVVCWMYHANLVTTLAALRARYKGPVLWNIRSSLSGRIFGPATWAVIAAGVVLSPLASGIIFNSARSQRQHTAFGYRNARQVTIPNGLETPPQPSPRTGIRLIGMVGRFDPSKDYLTFLRACAQIAIDHPQIRFTAAGRGVSHANPAFASLVKQSGLDPARIDLVGELQDLHAFYAGIDLMVLSSVSEGFPNVLLEAMASGAPSLTTNVGDAPQIVGSPDYVIPPSDPDALAAAMRRMIALPSDTYAGVSQAAWRQVNEHFGIAKVAALYDRFFAEARACAG
jgi:glycosyltransferase involved in cell wall biosynthesis